MHCILLRPRKNHFTVFLVVVQVLVNHMHVTKALYQAALKYYNTRPGIDFSQTKVLMLAPTGKATYRIYLCISRPFTA